MIGDGSQQSNDEVQQASVRAITPVAVSGESQASIIGSWLFIIVFFGAIMCLMTWALGSLITGQHILPALVSLVVFGGAVPSLMEDLGWHLAHRHRLYDAGKALLSVAQLLDRTIFCLVHGQTHSMNAMRLAQVALIRNRLEEALKWATIALAMSERDSWFGKFYANCILGQVEYAMGSWQQARNHLQQAQQLFDENIEKTPLATLRDKLRRFAVVNLDLLGRVVLVAGEKEWANKYFEKSYSLRLELPDRKPLADSFREHFLGLIAFHDFEVEQAHQQFEKALNLLPNDICRDYEEQTIAVEICTDATAYGQSSLDVALKSCDRLGQLQTQGLPPRLIELAAKPIVLLEESHE